MSEYWKSTPKYWCKHCKTFVRDTKLEKTNHEATPKHQGNLKRFLRDLHKGHEREERDKQRAKDEVNRLNGLASGSTSKEEGVPWERKGAVPRPAASGTRQATLAERKQQLAQLAEMGVAVPDDFRKEMAMVGDWQTTSQRLIYDRDPVKKEEDVGVKPESMSVGVRKRKFEGQVEEEETGVTVSRKGWGSTIKTYPGAGEEDDLDALLKKMRNAKGDDEDSGMQNMSTLSGSADGLSAPDKGPPPDKPPIKREESKEIGALSSGVKVVSIKQEEDMADPGLMFKKRKAKPIRQR